MEPQGLTILLVCDSEAERCAIARLLRREGCEVHEAANGKQALELARERPDVILLDMAFPDGNGFEVCRQLKADPQTARIPVLEISADFIQPECRIEALRNGADDCITHPVSAEELLVKLRVWRRLHQAEAEVHRGNARLHLQRDASRINEGRLRAALDVAQLGVWEYMGQGGVREETTPAGFTQFDERCCEVLGISETQPLSYERLIGLIYPEDRGQVEILMSRALAPSGSGVFNTEHRILRPDGTLRWIAMRGHTIPAGVGSVLRIVGTLRDITESKESEEALRQSEERYRRLVETATEGIWEIDNDFRIAYINARIAQLLGYEPDELIGHSVRDFIGLDEMKDVERREANRRRQDMVETFERELRCKNGSTLWALVSATSLRDRTGQVVGSLGMLTDITERKRAELALRESEQLLQFHMENTPLAVIEWGPDFRLSRWSGEAERVFGWRAEEVLGKRLDEFRWVHQDDIQQVTFVSAGLLDGTCRRSISCNRNYRKDGSVVYCEWYNSSRIDDSGKCVSILSLVLDITERKQTEDSLRESEVRFRMLADNISQFTWMADEQGWIFWYNQRWFEYTGTTLTEMEGWGWQKVHHPDHVQRVVEKFRRHLQTGEPWEDTFPLRGKDGQYRWFLSRARPIRDGSGRVIRWFGTNTDITEQREIEEALRSERDFSTAILQTAATLIVVIDREGRITRINDVCNVLTGYSADEVRGRYVWEFVPPEDMPGVRGTWNALWAGNFPNQHENHWVGKDGSRRLISWSNTALLDAKGEIEFVIATGVDITEAKRSEQLLIRSEKLASVGRLAASIAHEINNPLAAVMNTLYLAKTSEKLPASVQSYLDLADEELRRIAHITRQTLGFYRESSTPTLVSPGDIMDSALNLLDHKLKARNVTIEKDYDARLQINAVAGELRQVFSNLLMNSLDAIQLVGGNIKLRISRTRFPDTGKERLRVTVADDGEGILPAARQHIFEPLFTTKGAIGTGLGLWVSRQLVEKHGGTIRVHSSTHGTRRGTTVSVVLPMTDARKEAPCSLPDALVPNTSVAH